MNFSLTSRILHLIMVALSHRKIKEVQKQGAMCNYFLREYFMGFFFFFKWRIAEVPAATPQELRNSLTQQVLTLQCVLLYSEMAEA